MIAAILLSGLFLYRGERVLPYAQEWPVFLIIGTLNGWLPNILTAFALTQISTASSAMIQASGPLMVAIMAHFLFADERLSRIRLAGVVLGFMGMGLLIGPDALKSGTSGQAGFLAMTGCCLLCGRQSLCTPSPCDPAFAAGFGATACVQRSRHAAGFFSAWAGNPDRPRR